MKLGVTGASGKLGGLTVRHLLKTCKPEDIVAIVRDPAKAADLAAAGVEVRAADYTDVGALKAALSGVDKLLLVSSNELGRRFDQHKNVIDAALAAGVKQVVYTSAPKATTSTLILAPEHKATEEYLAASGLSYTVLRNNWYTENYANSIQTAAKSGELVAAVGAGRIASAERADFAEAAAAVLTGEGHEGRIYELTGASAWDFNDLAQAIAEAAGCACAYKPISADELKAAMMANGLDEGTAGFVATLDANIAAGNLDEVSGDLQKILGRPGTPLKETVKKLVG